MKETALVLKAAGRIAVVQIEKRPECSACKVCAFSGGKSRVKVKALNTAGAKAGDRVIVEAEKDNRALASFLVYVVPVLLAVVGVVVGAQCFEQELYAALLCLAGLAVGFMAVWIADKLLSKRRGFGIEVVEVLDIQKNASKGGNRQWSRRLTRRLFAPQWRRRRRSSSIFGQNGAAPAACSPL